MVDRYKYLWTSKARMRHGHSVRSKRKRWWRRKRMVIRVLEDSRVIETVTIEERLHLHKRCRTVHLWRSRPRSVYVMTMMTMMTMVPMMIWLWWSSVVLDRRVLRLIVFAFAFNF